jgi:hypothetical protein
MFALLGLVGLRVISRRTLEVDPKARKVRVSGSLGSGVRRLEIAADDLQGVELNAGQLMLQRKNHLPVLAAAARPADPPEPLAEAKARIEALLRGEARPQ